MSEYLDILKDPAHVAAEATFVAFEVALLTPVLRWANRRWHRKHDRREHDSNA